jgi:hypothetical protein
MLCANFAATVLAAVSTSNVKSWPAWMASMLNKGTVFETPLIGAACAIFDDLLGGRAPRVAVVPGGPTTKTEADYSPDYLDALRLAAQGTPWVDDDISWSNLLNNSHRQAILLAEYAAEQGA